MVHIKNILNLCGRQYFFKPVPFNTTESMLLKYDCGPAGELLRNNIHQEWFLSNVINSEDLMLPFTPQENGQSFQAIRDAFAYAKELCCDKLPFGISNTNVQMLNKLDPSPGSSEFLTDFLFMNHNKVGGSGYFYPEKHTLLRLYIFSHPAKSTQAFSFWQQQRKSWWRKFSGSPGRYSLTDVNSIPLGDLVMIRAEYPWGMQCLEALCLRGTKPFEEMDESTRIQFEVKDGRRSILPHVIECVTTLDGAMLTFLCDAYEERPLPTPSKVNSNSTDSSMRYTFHIHRRLAPYKASFSASSTSASSAEDLHDLAVYLTKSLRRSGISVLLLPDLTKKSLEAQHVRNDEMGIPYTIVMNESSLKNGIIGLRSLDTTLKEQLHITDLKSHMRKLLKNY
ncbi:DNA polymerase subunit gamma-2, mitochondrial isoform X1 [Ischnura elegans]|uniref:DNA polymerase subunit gamma-2, mitochondrial isoform X1 n=1 Tax=Ischnura elegans TaxID=197161 RepID=UPI001ED86FBF|nr:DNA polymerase subunit gamma-2, mitochondrial isoform X1 [Ischnura elegans]